MLSLRSKTIRMFRQVLRHQIHIATQTNTAPLLVNSTADLIPNLTATFSSTPVNQRLKIPTRAKPEPSPPLDVDTSSTENKTSDNVDSFQESNELPPVKQSSPKRADMKGYQELLLSPEQKQIQKLRYKLYLETAKSTKKAIADELSLSAVDGQVTKTDSYQLDKEIDNKDNLIKTKDDSEADADTPVPLKRRISDDTARIMGNARSSMYSIFKRITPSQKINQQKMLHKVDKKYTKNRQLQPSSSLHVKTKQYPKLHVPLPSFSEYVKTNSVAPALPKPAVVQNVEKPFRNLQPSERFLSDKPRFVNTKDIDTLLTSANKRPLPHLESRSSLSNRAAAVPKPAANQNVEKQFRNLQPRERFLSDTPRFVNTKDINTLLTSANKRPLPHLQSRAGQGSTNTNSVAYPQPFTRIKTTTYKRTEVQGKNRFAVPISKTIAESNIVKGKGRVFF